MYCPQCATVNEDAATVCVACKSQLVKPEVEASNEDFYAAAIGSSQQGYYLQRFNQFEENGKTGATWNWQACLFTFYWFLYRKMWANALIYFFVPYIVLIIIGVIAAILPLGARPGVVSLLFFAYAVGIFVVPGMYGNAFYYNLCREKIEKVKARTKKLDRQLGELASSGGTSVVGLVIGIGSIFVFMFVIGVLAAIAVPAYQTYTVKAKLATVGTFGKSAASAVENYYYMENKIPETLSDAGFESALPNYMKKIEVDSKTGIIAMTMGVQPIMGKKLLMVPSLDESKKIQWQCMSQEINNDLLPPECQKK